MHINNTSISLLFTVLSTCCFAMTSMGQSHTPFTGNESLSYDQAIDAYTKLANSDDRATLVEMGSTDVGEPLHLFIIDSDGVSKPDEISEEKAVFLINNGIHPGEPCGVDASVMLAREFLSGEKYYNEILEEITICIVPMYNVGGALNRGCCSRANQNGPRAYGFRGNAKNLDLNRDFIKADSKNAKSFHLIFHAADPEVLVDTHTSNGADYQYTMTLITTQPDKASPMVRDYIRGGMNDWLYAAMEKRGFPMTPYVSTMERTPESGIVDFNETPRYSTGYAALFNTIGFVSETHMLKPFEDRVESTYHFLMSLAEYTSQNAQELIEMRKSANEQEKSKETFALDWELDTTRYEMFSFMGYEHEMIESDVTGKKRLFYNQDKPFEKEIRYYNRYVTTDSVLAPDYYIIPQAWTEVIERLKWNNVKMHQLESDRTLDVELYYIKDFNTVKNVYEGHYLHSNVVVEKVDASVDYREGDYIVPVNQETNRFIVETLEPKGVDSFFAWNFFDSVLQQKEWFSDYVFEDTAEEMLEKNPELKEEFEEKRASDEEFAQKHWGQLYWIYQRSDNYENTVNRYPVARFFGEL
ncbi:M14 family zinc carboxypeptidase [Halocola ammonii]